jgi:hypothetical protein
MNNQLTYLPKLNENLQHLYCFNNQLTYLPELNKNLQHLNCCGNNKLTYLPELNERLKSINIMNIEIYDIPNEKYDILQKIKIINKFRKLYYSLKFKKQFRKWLWELVREPKIMQKYHPSYLSENLNEETNLEHFLENWTK